MERLLCIKIASRGDLLLAGPAFRALRRARPSAHITLMVGSSCEEVARHLPYFDDLKAVDDRSLLAGSRWEQIGEVWRILRWLRPHAEKPGLNPQVSMRYSEAFIFHRDWRYGLLLGAARIPVRHGLSRQGDFCFLTHPCVVAEKEHHANQYLELVHVKGELGTRNAEPQAEEGVGLGNIWHFDGGEKEAALEGAAAHGFKVGKENWIAMGFGGGRNVKTRTELKWWPVAHYRELARQLEGKGWRVVWVGDAEDAILLGDHGVGVNLAGKLRVSETAGVLSACKRVVTNDTFALHLAEALGVPTLALFGPTDPAHYRPLNAHSKYLWHGRNLACSPCHRDGYFPPCAFHHQCLEDLTVESVLKEIMNGEKW